MHSEMRPLSVADAADGVLAPAVEALPRADAQTDVGLFTYAPADDHWTWSPAVFALFGYEPGDVVPSTELARAHQHPDQPTGLTDLVRQAVAAPGPFGGYVRLLDSARRPRFAAIVGEHVAGPGGSGRLRGFMLDLTESRRAEVDATLTATLGTVIESRGGIERAKGALMDAYGIDADAAFGLLTWLSQRSNHTVRDLALRVLETLPPPDEQGVAAATAALLRVVDGAPVHPSPDDVEAAVLKARGGPY